MHASAFVQRDAAGQKRGRREEQVLADIGLALASTLDYEDTVSRISEIAVRDIADLCAVDLVDEHGVLQRARLAVREATHASIRDALQRVPINLKDLHWSAAMQSVAPVLMQSAHPGAFSRIDDRVRAINGCGLRSAIVAPLVAHGRFLGTMCLLSVTLGKLHGPEDLQLAREIARRAALALDNARLHRTAREAIQTRDEVLAIVAHDLRNPLSVILAKARLLQREGEPHPVGNPEALADGIHRVATHMNRLVQDLLEVTRVEDRPLKLERRRLVVREVLDETIALQLELACTRSLAIRLDLAQEVPDVWADRDRLMQVFANLVGNAVKFTPSGGVITIGATTLGTDGLFWVRDTGCGIAVQDQSHVFDRFWQAQSTRGTGSGLGLAIAKTIVEAHGGHVWVESSPGAGSTFFFSIPAAAGESDQPSFMGPMFHPSQNDDIDFGPAAGRSPRVILADDHTEILTAFERLLKPSCDVVAKATNHTDLIEAATRLQPDVVVVDVFLGTSNGFDCCRVVRQVAHHAMVIIVTAADDEAIEPAAMSVGPLLSYSSGGRQMIWCQPSPASLPRGGKIRKVSADSQVMP
jgi:signal transduction histidine kinase